MSEFRQRIGLVHELAQLAPAKEIPYNCTESLWVNQLLWCHPLDIHIEKSHPLLNQTLRSGQSNPALISQQLANRAHTPAPEVIDVVNCPVSLLEVEEILHGVEEILRYHDAFRRIHIDLELLVDLVATYTSEVVLLRVEEQAFQESSGIRRRRRITGPQLLVNILECTFLIFSRIFPERFEQDFIIPGVNHFDRLDLKGKQLSYHPDRQRVVGASHDEVSVLNVLEENHWTEFLLIH